MRKPDFIARQGRRRPPARPYRSAHYGVGELTSLLANSPARGAITSAYAAYQERLKPLLFQKQNAARKFASAFAPRSSLGLVMRNLTIPLLKSPRLADMLIGRDLRDHIKLPEYAWGVPIFAAE